MKYIIALSMILFCIAAHGQFVKPNQFPEETNPTNANFEVYSQKGGVNKRAQLNTLKNFFDQSLFLNNTLDSVCITKIGVRSCVKLPSGSGGAVSKRVFAVKSSGQNYTLPTDTLTKYDQFYVLYEALAAPSGSTVTLPTIGANDLGKEITATFYFTGSSALTSATISGSITTISGTILSNPTSITALAGSYRFIATTQPNGSGRRWQLISAPTTISGTSYVNAIVLKAATTAFDSTLFSTKDIVYIYQVSATGSSSFSVPDPTSRLVGKTLIVFPSRVAPYTNVVTANSNYLINIISGNTYTSTASITITQPTRFVCTAPPNNAAGYYWEYQTIDNSTTNELQTLSYVGDTLSISLGNKVRIPRADSVLLSSLQVIPQNRLIGRYSSGTGRPETIQLSSDFAITAGVLGLASPTTGLYQFQRTTLASGGNIIVTYYGTAPTVSGTNGTYTISIPAGCRPVGFNVIGTTSDVAGDGSISIIATWASIPSSINTAETLAFLPAITLIELATVSNVQLNNQSAAYQITHPVVSAGSTTTRVTGVSGLSSFVIKGTW